MKNISARHNLKEQTDLRKSLRNNATIPEAILWRRLKGKQVNGLKFRRQFGVGPYILDFYCPEIRLSIELDGEVHNTYSAEDHDNIRTRFLNENNIREFRFKNDVVYHNIESIVEEIIQYQQRMREGEKTKPDFSDHP